MTFTDDPFKDDTVIMIKKIYPRGYSEQPTEGPVPYTYVVSKLAGKWFVTGQDENGKGRGWAELLVWLGRGKIVSAQLATSFSRVVVL